MPFTFDSKIIDTALRRIQSRQINPRKEIDPGLFAEVDRIMQKAVDTGYTAPAGSYDFREQIRNNTEVFAAFKAHRMGRDMAAQLLDENGQLKSYKQFKKDTESIVSHHVDNWLRTEYDTAVKRAHKAAEMQQFRDEADVFPNIEWLPSTAVTPREEHKPFYHHIWPIDDPFWDHHKPGDEWGCQCDWAATDAPVTDNTGLDGDGGPSVSKGLGGDPSKTGQVFSQDHPYFPSDCKHCGFYTASIKNSLASVFYDRKKDCYNCPYIRACIDGIGESVELKKQRRVEFKKLQRNKDYKDVRFDKATGGLEATHKGHISHDGADAERFFEGLTSSDLERECQKQLYRTGHSAIFLDESKKYKGQKLPALDMKLDNIIMDIRSITGRGWYSHVFIKKNDQLRRYNNRTDIFEKADALCLYFHEPSLFDEQKMKKSINYFRYYRDKSGELLARELKRIFCVIKGKDNILVYEV